MTDTDTVTVTESEKSKEKQRMTDNIVPLAVLIAVMKERGVGEARMARIIRLNPNGFPQGTIPRGYGQPARLNWATWQIGKGRFIREHGRAAWDALPAIAKSKQGKREWVSEEAVVDRAWEFPPDHPARALVPAGKGIKRQVSNR